MVERKEPWITESANEWLSGFINNNRGLKIAEFGSGASTVWFLNQKNVDYLLSVEHDAGWYKSVALRLSKPHDYFHHNWNLSMTAFNYDLCERPYNKRIKLCNDEYFDFILIDGRDRVKCIASAIPKLKKGGVLMLDNSERIEYVDGVEMMKGWDTIVFYQPLPDKYGFTYDNWQTSIFTKP